MTRMIPPQSSARSLRAMPHPKRMPNIRPTIDKANDTKPIIPMGERMAENCLMPRSANETPTANASMLVATARASTTFRLVGSYSCFQPSSLKDSIIIRPPRKARILNAIQWSILSIRWLKKLAPIHPSRGIKAWKEPKLMLITSIGRSRTRFNIIPLAIETAKQSIASPTASSQISNPVISAYRGSL